MRCPQPMALTGLRLGCGVKLREMKSDCGPLRGPEGLDVNESA